MTRNERLALNAEYWHKREAEALKYYIKNEAEYDKRIQQIYQDQLDAIEREINAFYGRYAGKEGITIAEAKKRVSKLDIEAYERKAERYVKEKDFSKQANEEMRLYNATMRINRLEMLKANIGLEMLKGHIELEEFMQDILDERVQEENERLAGILGKTVRSNAKTAHAIPNASFHNATFSERIWVNQSAMRADLAKLIEAGLIRGKNARELARDLKKYIGDSGNGATYRAERLMRTELARVQIEAQRQSYERNGIEYFEIIANSGCCDECRGLDGKVYKVSALRAGENAPPFHPNCRCSTAPWKDSDEYEAWLDYVSKGGTTEEWDDLDENLKKILIKRKHREIQEKAMAKSVSFDITEDGKYTVLPYKYEQYNDYKNAVMPEYHAQRMTHADNTVLWDYDKGYIQNGKGCADINAYQRGLVKTLEPKYENTINVLDRRTNNPTLKHDYIGFRKVDMRYISNVLGIDVTRLTAKRNVKTRLEGTRRIDVPKNKGAAQSIADKVNGLVGTTSARVVDNGYTSISMAEDINYFTHFPVQFQIQIPRGTKGLLTSNWKESEFITKRGSTLEILGAEEYNDGEKDCIRIWSRLIQE